MTAIDTMRELYKDRSEPTKWAMGDTVESRAILELAERLRLLEGDVRELAGKSGFDLIEGPLLDSEPKTAGLTGYDLYDNQGHYRQHYATLAEAHADNREGYRIVDRSLIPATAFVKAEPKSETRKVWLAFSDDDVTVSSQRPERNWFSSLVHTIVEREITFTRGEGMDAGEGT